jgi:predicted RNA binding protein YcfA (HicA-like mRNA interferase family)
MRNPRKTCESVLRAQGSIAFRDLERLVFRLGFRLDRVSGSHHIYVHPKVSRPLNIQPIGKDAKPYQVRQLRDIIVKLGLTLEEK